MAKRRIEKFWAVITASGFFADALNPIGFMTKRSAESYAKREWNEGYRVVPVEMRELPQPARAKNKRRKT